MNGANTYRQDTYGTGSSKQAAYTSRNSRVAPDDVQNWFEGTDPNSIRFDRLSMNRQDLPTPYEDYERNWRQPKFRPTQAYDRALAKERMLLPQIGGRSKKAQLGSIEESWGSKPKVMTAEEVEEERKGMFELDEDPPSRNVSPFKEEDEELEIERKRQEFLTNARRGTRYDPVNETPSYPEGERYWASERNFDREENTAVDREAEDVNSPRAHEKSRRTASSLVRYENDTPDRAHHPHNTPGHNGNETDDDQYRVYDIISPVPTRSNQFHASEYNHQRSQEWHKPQEQEYRPDSYDPRRDKRSSFQVLGKAPERRFVRERPSQDNIDDLFSPTSNFTKTTTQSFSTYHRAGPQSTLDSRTSHAPSKFGEDVQASSSYTQAGDYQAWLKRSERGGKRR